LFTSVHQRSLQAARATPRGFFIARLTHRKTPVNAFSVYTPYTFLHSPLPLFLTHAASKPHSHHTFHHTSELACPYSKSTRRSMCNIPLVFQKVARSFLPPPDEAHTRGAQIRSGLFCRLCWATRGCTEPLNRKVSEKVSDECRKVSEVSGENVYTLIFR
jgi:hypothetical protein